MLRSKSSHSAWQLMNKSMNLQAPAIVLIENDEVTLDLYQRELANPSQFSDLPKQTTY